MPAALGGLPYISSRRWILLRARLLAQKRWCAGLDEDGTIIPPGRFIGTLEKSGNIRELDLFVLNQTMAQMEAWRAAGLGMVKVSVNLSRVSLFAPTTLASILAIASPLSQHSAGKRGIGNHRKHWLARRFPACRR